MSEAECVATGTAPKDYRFPTPKKKKRAPEEVANEIYSAAVENKIEELALLVQQWAGNKVISSHQNDQGLNALLGCAYKGQEGCVRLLVAAGANVEERLTSDNRTAMHLAAGNDRSNMVLVLLDVGADLEARMMGITHTHIHTRTHTSQ